jgi:hypothetical protein
MCNHLARHAIQNEVTSFKTALNLVAGTINTVGNAPASTYLLLQDQFGYQVYIAPQDDFYTLWSAIFQGAYAGPVSATTLCAGNTFTAIKTWAEALYTDIAAKIPDVVGSKVFLAGHCVGGIMATLIANKLQTTNRQVGVVVTTGAPRAYDLTMWDAITPDIRQVFNRADALCCLPPPMTWDQAFYGAGVQLPTQMYSKGEMVIVGPRSNWLQSGDLINALAARAQNRFNWPAVVLDACAHPPTNAWSSFQDEHLVNAYVNSIWAGMRDSLKYVVDEARAWMNQTYGYNLRAGNP